MYLKRILSINIAILAATSTLILGLGHGEPELALWTIIAAAAAIWLTDTLQIVRLNHRWANLAILAVVIFSIGDLYVRRGDSLAFGIARILVFMQMILLFRDKDQRCFGHLLSLSILQVVVAASFEQGAAFGLLLLFYIFMLLSSGCLLFLFSEAEFYREHAETLPHYGLRSSLYLKQTDWRMLRKVAFATFIAGPFSLFLQKDAGAKKEKGPPLPFFEQKKTNEEAAASRRFRKRGPATISAGRWPQAFEEPHFSGASVSGSREGVRKSLWGLTASITAKSALLALVVFLITPRAGFIRLGPLHLEHVGWGKSGGGMRTIGVPTDTMRLGELGGDLYQSYETVMQVSFRREGTEYPYDVSDTVYLHGREFTNYENKAWTELKRSDPEDDWFRREPRSAPRPSAQLWNEAMDCDKVEQVLEMEPTSDNLIFCIHPYYSTESGRRQQLTTDMQGRLIRTSVREGSWTATLGTSGFKEGSRIDLYPCVEEIDIGAMGRSPNSRDFSGLIALADSWIAESGIPSSDPIGRARYLERQLRDSGDFYYSLEAQARSNSLDPIEDFVTKNRAGHCEYFASALVLMLRSQGIPARVVVGYCGGIYNPLGRHYQIRQMDAHSWVQAYIAPDYLEDVSSSGDGEDLWTSGAWLRLDATPEVDPSMLGDLAGQFSGWKDRFAYLWQHYVVNMNGAQQSDDVYDPLRNIGDVIKDLFHGSWWHTQWLSLKNLVIQNWYALKEGRWISVRGGITASLLALLSYLAFRFARFLFRIGRKTASFLAGHAPQHLGSRIDFYRRLEQILGEYGLNRRTGETQREFAMAAGTFLRENPDLLQKNAVVSTESVTEEKDAPLTSEEPCNELLSDAPRDICESFYRVRFGNQKLSSQDRRCIDKALRALRK